MDDTSTSNTQKKKKHATNGGRGNPARQITCPDCGERRAYYARGRCNSCYNRLIKRELGEARGGAGGQRQHLKATVQCRDCRSRFRPRGGGKGGDGKAATSPYCNACLKRRQHRTPCVKTDHYRAAEVRSCAGLVLSTLLDGAAEDAERARRVEVYARQVEECGQILWGRVDPPPQQQSQAAAGSRQVALALWGQQEEEVGEVES